MVGLHRFHSAVGLVYTNRRRVGDRETHGESTGVTRAGL